MYPFFRFQSKTELMLSLSRICYGCSFAFGSFDFSNTFYEVSVCLHPWIAVGIDVMENTL